MQYIDTGSDDPKNPTDNMSTLHITSQHRITDQRCVQGVVVQPASPTHLFSRPSSRARWQQLGIGFRCSGSGLLECPMHHVSIGISSNVTAKGLIIVDRRHIVIFDDIWIDCENRKFVKLHIFMLPCAFNRSLQGSFTALISAAEDTGWRQRRRQFLDYWQQRLGTAHNPLLHIRT